MTTLAGLKVFDVKPDFPDETLLRGWRRQSFTPMGAAKYGVFPSKDAVHTLQNHYVLKGAQVREVEEFHVEHAGKWKPFLLPSWISELGNGETNSITTPTGSPSLAVDWCDYARAYGSDLSDYGRLGSFVFVLFPDGTFAARQVTAVSASVPGDYDLLDLSGDWPFDVVPGDGCVIGFCYHVRMLSDELQLVFSGPGSAACDLAFVQALVSTPEADVA